MVQTAAHGPNIATVTGVTDCGKSSTVLASICEYNPVGGPFIGDAPMWIYNIVPQDGEIVQISYYVSWNTDLNVQLNIQVC
jgi:hypothetical protein